MPPLLSGLPWPEEDEFWGGGGDGYDQHLSTVYSDHIEGGGSRDEGRPGGGGNGQDIPVLLSPHLLNRCY